MPSTLPACRPLRKSVKEGTQSPEHKTKDYAELQSVAAAAAARNLRQLECAQPFLQPQRTEAAWTSSERLPPTTTNEAASRDATISYPSARTAATVSTAQTESSSHHGSIFWSRVPGFCGLCGAATSRWSSLTGDPPWLPMNPHSRAHLRLLWGFYAASVPTSCLAMQEAIRIGDLSALRAEAALLSLISGALGFTSLSLSARRVAEICDLKDAGAPNPAWGPHHPLAAAEWTDISRIDMNQAKWMIQQRQHEQQYSSSYSSGHDSDAAEANGQLFEEASAPEHQVLISVVGGPYGSKKPLKMPAMRKRLPDTGLPQADVIRAGGTRNSFCVKDCNERMLRKPHALIPHEHTQQQHTQQQYRFLAQRIIKRREQEKEKRMRKEHHGTGTSERPPNPQRLQQHRFPLDSTQQAFHAHQKRRQRVQQQCSAVACLDGLHSSIGAFGEAVAKCFVDLHDAKAKLAPLFKDGATAALAAATAVAAAANASKDDVASHLTNSQCAQSSYLEIITRFKSVLAAIGAAITSRPLIRATAANWGVATAERGKTPKVAIAALAGSVVATKAAITTAKAALRLAALWGRIGGDDVASSASSVPPDAVIWLPFSFSRTWSYVTAPRHLLLRVREKASAAATSLAASSVAAAIAAAQKTSSPCPQRDTVLLGQWLRTSWFPGAACIGPAQLLKLLKQVLVAVEVATCRKWDASCCLLKRLARHFTAALQHVLRLLLILWETPGFMAPDTSTPSSLRQASSCMNSRNCRTGDRCCMGTRMSCSGTRWTTPEGLRQTIATSACYWSPMESTLSMRSSKEPTESLAAGPLLPVPRREAKQQAQVVEHQALEQLQVEPLRFPLQLASPSTPHAAFRNPAVSAKFLTATLPLIEFTGLDSTHKSNGGVSRRGSPFRRFPKARGVTRAAAAGAAAAAATASWGAGVSLSRRAGSQGGQRHVSFRTGSDEELSTFTPLQKVIWGHPNASQPPGLAPHSGAKTP